MKNFSDLQKRIINKIIELDEKSCLNVLGNILENELDMTGKYYIEIVSKDECILKINNDYFESSSRKYDSEPIKYLVEAIKKQLIIIVTLFDYLEKNELVIVTGDLDLKILGAEVIDKKYIPYEGFDREIVNLLYKYSRKRFTPTEFLKKLVANNYKSDEEIRYEKQNKHNNRIFIVAIISIFISACALISSVIF